MPATLFAQASQPQNYHFFNKNNTIAVIFIHNNIFYERFHYKDRMHALFCKKRPPNRAASRR